MATINPNQQGKLLSLATPAGENGLITTSVQAKEKISELFEVIVTAWSSQNNINANQMLGKSATLSVSNPKNSSREFNGIITSFGKSFAVVRGLRQYKLVIRPKLWLLTKTSDCRIFQNKTVLQITDTILSENGINNYKKNGITGSHESHDYCVQYMETDYEFLTRIWAQEGIYFYFTHTKSDHILTLSDSCSGYYECADKEVMHAPSEQNQTMAIDNWLTFNNFVSGKYTLNDYNFEQPKTDMNSTTNTNISIGAMKPWEIYEYPGGFNEKTTGQTLSRGRMEFVETDYSITDGQGKYRNFCPAAKITMKSHEIQGEEEKKYVILSVEHRAEDNTHLGANNEDNKTIYSNQFTVLPAETVFRPHLNKQKPMIPGPQTAKVVGPSGEEIYCDKYGRIKVQFHWDRQGKNDENSSCWVRVAQIFAGNNWGSIFTPRIGMEVIVIFMDGDPDRPMVTGAVYNKDNMPPYSLPNYKTKSGFKTRSTTKGSTSTYNELWLEDKKDSELFYLRAQKDFQKDVMNNDTVKVNNDQSVTIVNNRSEEIQNGNLSTTVSKGNIDVKCTAGNISFVAGNAITFQVGSNSISINQSGITIKGTMLEMSATATAKLQGQILQLNGGGMVEMSGGLIKIN